MKFKKGDRIASHSHGRVGTIDGVTFNSIYQEDEYIVKWDLWPLVTETHSVRFADNDWYLFVNDNTLPTGMMYNSPVKSCEDGFHNWKIYKGLNFDDEYCTKCNIVREIKE